MTISIGARYGVITYTVFRDKKKKKNFIEFKFIRKIPFHSR